MSHKKEIEVEVHVAHQYLVRVKVPVGSSYEELRRDWVFISKVEDAIDDWDSEDFGLEIAHIEGVPLRAEPAKSKRKAKVKS